MERMPGRFEAATLQGSSAIPRWIDGSGSRPEIRSNEQEQRQRQTERRALPMNQTFDIFQLDEGGTLLWKGTAATLDEAKLIVKELARLSGVDHVIADLRTGMRLTITAAEADGG
jgi:hypothetical protein